MTDSQYICSRHSDTLVYKIDPFSLTPGPIMDTRNTHSRFPCVPLCIWYSASGITIKRITFLSNNGHRIQFSLNKKKATLLQRWELMESCRFASKWDHTSIRPHKDGRKRKLDRNLLHHTPHTAQTRPVFQATQWLALSRCCLSSMHLSITFFFQCGEIHTCGIITYVCPLIRKFNFPVIIPKLVRRTCHYVSLHICIRFPTYVAGKQHVRICVRRLKIGNKGKGRVHGFSNRSV